MQTLNSVVFLLWNLLGDIIIKQYVLSCLGDTNCLSNNNICQTINSSKLLIEEE